MQVSDRVTVLRDGKVVGKVKTSDTNKEELANMMVGRPLITSFEKGSVEATKNILEIKNVRAKNDRNLIALKDISLDIKDGEILGIAGVDGNGQSELAEVLIGMRKTLGGTVNKGNINGQMFFKFGLAAGTYFKNLKKSNKLQ